MYCGENMESNVYFHVQDEAERLLKEIELMMKNVENSELYAGMRFDLKHNETFQQRFLCLLGSHSHVQVVIYALGSMESSFNSQFQLAVVLLLKRDFPNWIGNIEVYDPLMSPADTLVLRKLGFEVLTIDENCKRQVRGPTMFYKPVPSYWLIGNLLGANWSSSCINQIFLLTNSFRDLLTNISPCNQKGETRQRLERILPFTTEIGIKTSHEEIYTNVFLGFAWHFFDVGPKIDMETSLPVTKITKYRRNSGQQPWLDWQR
ncbi:protein SENSITIVITY TO RED LIGHT REDUCED 1-like [Lycium ferocissimum]|uniref:protein SENSITIVITY TO RED LIGHT REDUCED 1-like n=1 Tax=Lycium ferocissimum TaxID=112874 RepID=UPI0028153CB1|nr:protein SENSITIVITY TO RED LIGHT REDUCED 1-like [Lycium ferocissimum]